MLPQQAHMSFLESTRCSQALDTSNAHLLPVPKIQPVEEGLQGAAAVPVLVVWVQVAAISVVGISGLKPAARATWICCQALCKT